MVFWFYSFLRWMGIRFGKYSVAGTLPGNFCCGFTHCCRWKILFLFGSVNVKHWFTFWGFQEVIFGLPQEAELVGHFPHDFLMFPSFLLMIHKRCHQLYPLVHKHFFPEPLCHKRRKAVPYVKWEKERIIKASRPWVSCPPLSLSLWVSWARDPPS